MRILFCNKYNFAFSGTEVYLFEAMELLRAHGHEVALFSMADARGQPTPYDRHFMPHTDFKKQNGWLKKVRLAGQAIYSLEARRRIQAMIAEFQPDVAHVRNIYHHLSPSILWELKAQKIPVLYHLNDFKVLCPGWEILGPAAGEVLSGMGRAGNAGGGGLYSQMAGNVSKMRGLLSGSQPVCTRQICGAWMGGHKVRSSSPLPVHPSGFQTANRERSVALLWPTVARERRGGPAARHASSA